MRRSLSKLLTSVFLLNIELGAATRGNFNPYQNFVEWLNAAKADGKLDFGNAGLAARMFYGLVEGCVT